MKKNNICDCYQEKTIFKKYSNETVFALKLHGFDEKGYTKTEGHCNGTRECNICQCKGNTKYCDFYPEKRKESK